MILNETQITGQEFRIGRAVITRGALTFCEDREINYLDLLMRHGIGDFGDVGKLASAILTDEELELGVMATSDDLKLNAVAIRQGEGMVMSVFPCPKTSESKIWIQTLLAEKETYTTVLLPSEY